MDMLNPECLRTVQVEHLNRQFDVFRLEVWAVDRSWGLISITIRIFIQDQDEITRVVQVERRTSEPCSPTLRGREKRKSQTRRSRKSGRWYWQKIKTPWKVSQESLEREGVDIGIEADGGSSKPRTETRPLHLARESLRW